MTRRNALDRLRKDGIDPIAFIPLAERPRRFNRTWDQAHRGITYFIPASLSEQAKDVRTAILALAQKHLTTTSNIAEALMTFSLAHVHQGKLSVEARPNSTRRKMTVTWQEVRGHPQKIPRPASRIAKSRTKNMYLNYRWGRDIDAQIKVLAGESISAGDVVIYLLKYALAAYKRGRLLLKEEMSMMSDL